MHLINVRRVIKYNQVQEEKQNKTKMEKYPVSSCAIVCWQATLFHQSITLIGAVEF